jgi:hypothetical protein
VQLTLPSLSSILSFVGSLEKWNENLFLNLFQNVYDISSLMWVFIFIACTDAFREFETLRFKFGVMGFAGNARKDIEKQTGKPVVTSDNNLNLSDRSKKDRLIK